MLYDGTAGIALFLAALAHTLGAEEFRLAALDSLSVLRDQLELLSRDPQVAAARRFRLGGMIGLGAHVYCLLRIGIWLDEPALTALAGRVAMLITRQRIAGDDALDVLQGCAGAIPALLLLDQLAPAEAREAQSLERAVACGEHLLLRRTAESGQPRAWPANGYRPWCGFAHGAAGIAGALSRLAERTGRADFLHAAQEALAFERLHFSSAHKNWRDLRGDDERYMTAWCYGAPGIALGRLAMAETAYGADLASASEAAELNVALETTQDDPESPLDHLCCGNLGRADVLLEASRRLRRPDLEAAALALAERALERVHHAADGVETDARLGPSFFLGAAGIGYTCLRLAGTPLPCVLALE